LFEILKLNIAKKQNIILSLFFFTGSFAVSERLNGMLPFTSIPVVILTTALSAIYLMTYLVKTKNILLNEFEKKIICLFMLPIIFSIIVMIITAFIKNRAEYWDFLRYDFPGRFILIIANITILIGLLSLTRNWSKNEIINLIRKYYYGLLIFPIVGLWQFLNFTFNFPMFELHTRTHLHGLSTSNALAVGRLTSFADEPSFLAPLLIDLMIFAILVSKKPFKVIALSLFVLIFSYSAGGYLNLLIVGCALLVGYLRFKKEKITLNRQQRFNVAIALVIFLSTLIVLHESIFQILYPVIGRFGSIFDLERHMRIYMTVMPFIWVTQGSFINCLFGFGPKSYAFLRRTRVLPTGASVHITSNNFLVDTVFELGYIGFFSYIVIFIRFFVVSFKNLQNNKYYLSSLILSTHLFASSIYRADFMQPRFWIIFFVIFKLVEMGKEETPQI